MLFTFAEYFLQINFISLDALSRNSERCRHWSATLSRQITQGCSHAALWGQAEYKIGGYPIDTLIVLCAQLTRDLFVIAKFLFT